MPKTQRQHRQLVLVNQIFSLLQQQTPTAISRGGQLHPSFPLQQGLPLSPLLLNEFPNPLMRPLIPLADGNLLSNAPSKPSLGLALQA